MKGRRVVVVGASSGIGRAFATRVIDAGADVVLVARRPEALAAVAASAGGGSVVAADICDPADRERLVAEAVEHLGGIDLLVSTVGQGVLGPLTDADDDAWRRMFEVNVIGFNQLLRVALPHVAAGGIVAALSSESAAVPWAGLVPYAAAKSALETALRGWRVEQPSVRFCCVVVGATAPTDFGADFDHDQLKTAFESWRRHGRLQEEIMSADDLSAVLLATLAGALDHPRIALDHVELRSSSAVVGSEASP